MTEDGWCSECKGGTDKSSTLCRKCESLQKMNELRGGYDMNPSMLDENDRKAVPKAVLKKIEQRTKAWAEIRAAIDWL